VAAARVAVIANARCLWAGERFGLIKFGSRVDTHLLPDSLALVAVGRQVYGGQTAVARWPETQIA